jgi:hypothetical protein
VPLIHKLNEEQEVKGTPKQERDNKLIKANEQKGPKNIRNLLFIEGKAPSKILTSGNEIKIVE